MIDSWYYWSSLLFEDVYLPNIVKLQFQFNSPVQVKELTLFSPCHNKSNKIKNKNNHHQKSIRRKCTTDMEFCTKSRPDDNYHGEICPYNICPGYKCHHFMYTSYLSCYTWEGVTWVQFGFISFNHKNKWPCDYTWG